MVVLGLLVGMLVGCGFWGVQNEVEIEDLSSGFVTVAPGTYDSEDMAIVVNKDEEAFTLQLQNLQTGKRYTLQYDGATQIFDKYSHALAMSQIKLGYVVQVQFYKPKKLLTSIQEVSNGIKFAHTNKYSIDTYKGTITLGGMPYNLSSHLVVTSEDGEIDINDLESVDTLSVYGYNNQVYGIHVENGHSYLKLKNDDYFVGGWIEVGNQIIRQITKDMILTVPEGTNMVTISKNGNVATEEMYFTKNQDLIWDVGEVEVEIVKRGTILFTAEPSNMVVKIDGEKIDVSKPLTLEYGLHRLVASADGYQTVSQYIKVGEASANLDIRLDTYEGEEENTSEKEPEETKQTALKATDSGYRVFIDAPVDVEVYVDGNYIGIAPVDFAKVEGSYVISLRKTGFQPRSYTLQIDGEEKNVNYSFSELVAIE